MPLPSDNPRLSDYLAMARRRWRTVALLTAFVVLLSGWYAVRSPADYSATAIIDLAPPGRDPVPDPQLELAVLKGAEVAGAAAEQLGFVPRVEAARVGDSAILSVTAQADTREQAVQAANAYALVYVEHRNARELARLLAGQETIEQRIADVTALPEGGPAVDGAALRELRLAADLLADAALSGRLAAVEAAAADVRAAAGGAGTEDALALVRRARLEQLLDELVIAAANAEQVGPRVVVPADETDALAPASLPRVVPVALVVGLLVGLAVALVRELRDRAVRDAADVASEGGPPVLLLTGDAGEEAAGAGGDALGDEALRAALVLALPQGGVVQVCAVSDVDAGQRAARRLESALERGGREVRRLDPGSAEEPGAGADQLPPVTSARFADALAEHRAAGRFVVLASRAAVSGDARVLAGLVDGTLLVVARGADDRDSVRRALADLRGAGATVLAIVLTGSRPATPDSR